MSALAAIRPDEWDLPLFVHVLGAFILVGALVTAATFLFMARRVGSLEHLRWGFRTLLYGALPAFIVTRLSAQWLYSEEGLDEVEAELAWVDMGFISTDAGLLFLLIGTITAGVAVRRAGAAGEGPPRTRTAAVATASWLSALLVVVFMVVIWAMAAKPA